VTLVDEHIQRPSAALGFRLKLRSLAGEPERRRSLLIGRDAAVTEGNL
jgi:hypothetical protein